MADITSSCIISGSNQANERPFDWHVWKIIVPDGTLTASQVDDVLLPDKFVHGTIVLDAKISTSLVMTIATTCVVSFERARELISSGALDQKADLIAGDLELIQTAGISEAAGVSINDWSDLEANGGLRPAAGVAPLYRGRLNVEFNPVGAITAGDSEIYVAALLGRVDY